jgi:hypothetical protein
LSASQVAYGLRITSNLPLPGIVHQVSQASIDLRIRLKQEPLFPSWMTPSSDGFSFVSQTIDECGEPTLRVCMLGGGNYFGFFYGDGARFAIDCQGQEVWADWPDGYSIEDACTYLIGPVIAFALRLRGIVSLHASAVAIGNSAVAIIGVAGAGKSTTAAVFALNGYPVLTDDVVVLADHGDQFLVQPGYPRVNLWPDSVRMLFGSEDALPRITPTWDKRYLPLDKDAYRFQPNQMPLGAIYILGEPEKDSANPIIEELTGHKALATLAANTYVNYLLDPPMRSLEFDVLSRVLNAVPARRLSIKNNQLSPFDICKVIAADARQVGVGSKQTQ